jgi:hypothetical protein
VTRLAKFARVLSESGEWRMSDHCLAVMPNEGSQKYNGVKEQAEEWLGY